MNVVNSSWGFNQLTSFFFIDDHYPLYTNPIVTGDTVLCGLKMLNLTLIIGRQFGTVVSAVEREAGVS